MKKMICAVILAALAGCAWLEEIGLKQKAHDAVLDYAETKGQLAARNFVDQCVAEGKFTEEQGNRIKAAIPQGIEKLREVMGEIKEEQKQEETK